ncbi:hypothetical protein [Leuconostoc suionicum]|uniref:hypothetical protein n=1 Tax=Leuconostoc suionicum TaxID=1511761 RepID=UPI0024AD3617|nr:hypothetical protein [Leuconostoc suionicum]MDI6649739.1 hypothetical protein [Leuconostoc suionicum]
MFIPAIIGFVAIFWCVLTGLVRLIPWLILAVIVISIADLFFNHFMWVVTCILAISIACNVYTESKKRKNKSSDIIDGDYEEIKK